MSEEPPSNGESTARTHKRDDQMDGDFREMYKNDRNVQNMMDMLIIIRKNSYRVTGEAATTISLPGPRSVLRLGSRTSTCLCFDSEIIHLIHLISSSYSDYFLSLQRRISGHRSHGGGLVNIAGADRTHSLHIY